VLTFPAPDTWLDNDASSMSLPSQAIFLLSDVLLREDPQADLPLDESCRLRTHRTHLRAERMRRLWTSVQNPAEPPGHPQQRLSGLLTVGARAEASGGTRDGFRHADVQELHFVADGRE
jgi:hypothetical protein